MLKKFEFKDGSFHYCIQFTDENFDEIMEIFKDDDRIEYDGSHLKLYTDTIITDDETIIEGDLFHLYGGDWIILTYYDEDEYSIDRELDEVFQDLIVKD